MPLHHSHLASTLLRLWFSCSRSPGPSPLGSSLTQTKTLPSRVESRTQICWEFRVVLCSVTTDLITRAAASLSLYLQPKNSDCKQIIQFSVQSLSGSHSEPVLRAGKFHPELKLISTSWIFVVDLDEISLNAYWIFPLHWQYLLRSPHGDHTSNNSVNRTWNIHCKYISSNIAKPTEAH
jgi:hypothetical protein